MLAFIKIKKWGTKKPSKTQCLPRDTEILGWRLAGPVLPYGEKVPLWPWLATLLVMVSR